MSDLELSFCCDEDCMERLETHELVPGIKVISVRLKTGTGYCKLPINDLYLF